MSPNNYSGNGRHNGLLDDWDAPSDMARPRFGDVPEKRTLQILGIPFMDNSTAEAVELALRGGLMVVPAAPPLVGDFLENSRYREALMHADFVLPDSGAMVLMWNLAHPFSPAKRLSRLSGLEFLKSLVSKLCARPEIRSFWIMPSEAEKKANLRWLHSKGLSTVCERDCYVAPNYAAKNLIDENGLQDPGLLAILENVRPDVIIINLGGGTQELLGLFLKRELSFMPSIICTGAAIAFLSGCQTTIPDWADRYYLGWFLRILHAPEKFGPRYFRALKILWLLARYREELPQTQAEAKSPAPPLPKPSLLVK